MSAEIEPPYPLMREELESGMVVRLPSTSVEWDNVVFTDADYSDRLSQRYGTNRVSESLQR